MVPNNMTPNNMAPPENMNIYNEFQTYNNNLLKRKQQTNREKLELHEVSDIIPVKYHK